MSALLRPGVASLVVLPDGAREAVGCMCREERVGLRGWLRAL